MDVREKSPYNSLCVCVCMYALIKYSSEKFSYIQRAREKRAGLGIYCG